MEEIKTVREAATFSVPGLLQLFSSVLSKRKIKVNAGKLLTLQIVNYAFNYKQITRHA